METDHGSIALRNGEAAALVLEDEDEWAALMLEAGASLGWRIERARSLKEAERAVLTRRYDIAVIDRLLAEGSDGLALIATMKSFEITPMILVVSQLSTVNERISGLMAGADDYLPKPFDMAELKARLVALARRQGRWANYPTVTLVDQLEIRRAARSVAWKGEAIRLPDQLFDLLCAFVARRGEILSKEHLWSEVWSDYRALEPQHNAIEAAVGRLRRLLEQATGRSFITSIRGRGYRFDAE